MSTFIWILLGIIVIFGVIVYIWGDDEDDDKNDGSFTTNITGLNMGGL